jgi:hypothetical protein
MPPASGMVWPLKTLCNCFFPWSTFISLKFSPNYLLIILKLFGLYELICVELWIIGPWHRPVSNAFDQLCQHKGCYCFSCSEASAIGPLLGGKNRCNFDNAEKKLSASCGLCLMLQSRFPVWSTFLLVDLLYYYIHCLH